MGSYDLFWKLCVDCLAKLPGISIRVLYFVLISTSCLICEEMSNKLGNIATKFQQESQIDCGLLENWRYQYHLTSLMVDKISSIYDLIVLLNLHCLCSLSILYFCSAVLMYAFLVSITCRHDVFGLAMGLNTVIEASRD